MRLRVNSKAMQVKVQREKESSNGTIVTKMYGNLDCQAAQGFAKHVAAANAETCCCAKAQGR